MAWIMEVDMKRATRAGSIGGRGGRGFGCSIFVSCIYRVLCLPCVWFFEFWLGGGFGDELMDT